MKKNIALLLGLSLSLTAVGCALPASETRAESSKELIVSETPTGSEEMDTTGTEAVTMYRLYNPNSGEHFYTKDESEKNNLVKAGWSDEGIGWIAPEKSDTPVYRLYNANAGDHHYTMNAKERDELITAGWKDEGTGWYSDDDKTVPLYREYNPNAVTGTHNYTTDKAEHDNLVKAGWHDEGIGWYGIEEKKDDPPKEPDDDSLEIGDMVILGKYEQDNDLTNGPEPIEWQYIADRDGHKMLLSKYVLDSSETYNKRPTGNGTIPWKDCTLREWLNNEFYNSAFSDKDKTRIITAHNENPDTWELYKPWNTESVIYGAEGGEDTDDNVFLLSWVEVRDYFDGDIWSDTKPYNQALLCKPTPYVLNQGLEVYENKSNSYPDDTVGCCRWWLRSPGVGKWVEYDTATHASMTGVLTRGATSVGGFGTRPAILID